MIAFSLDMQASGSKDSNVPPSVFSFLPGSALGSEERTVCSPVNLEL